VGPGNGDVPCRAKVRKEKLSGGEGKVQCREQIRERKSKKQTGLGLREKSQALNTRGVSSSAGIYELGTVSKAGKMSRPEVLFVEGRSARYPRSCVTLEFRGGE